MFLKIKSFFLTKELFVVYICLRLILCLSFGTQLLFEMIFEKHLICEKNASLFQMILNSFFPIFPTECNFKLFFNCIIVFSIFHFLYNSTNNWFDFWFVWVLLYIFTFLLFLLKTLFLNVIKIKTLSRFQNTNRLRKDCLNF